MLGLWPKQQHNRKGMTFWSFAGGCANDIEEDAVMIRNSRQDMPKTEKVVKFRNVHYSLARKNESLLDPAGRWRVPHEVATASVRATTIKADVTCKECLKVLNEK
jgi:hypothetical protein